MLYMVTFTISITPMLAYIPYMDPMGYDKLGYQNCELNKQKAALSRDFHSATCDPIC